jgi:hypothetical protein
MERRRASKKMMEIVENWRSKMRISANVKRRSEKEQSRNAMDNQGTFVQLSGYRDEHSKTSGLESQPDGFSQSENDDKRLIADSVEEKRTETKIVVDRLKKKLLLGKQIHSDPIPKLEGFLESHLLSLMISTRCPIRS